MKAIKRIQSTESLKLDYIQAAAYFWYKAEGQDEQLVSALNRMKAQKIAIVLGGHTPSADEAKAWAEAKWPAHQRHA